MDAESLQESNKNPRKYMEQTSLKSYKRHQETHNYLSKSFELKEKEAGRIFPGSISHTLALFLWTCFIATFTARQKKDSLVRHPVQLLLYLYEEKQKKETRFDG